MTELRSIARTRAVIVHPSVKTKPHTSALNGELERHRSADSRLEETESLADAIALEVVDAMVVAISEIRPSTYVGSGKVHELAEQVKDAHADLVIMDCALSPVQQRNLERAWKVKVIDRTGLILEIFGERAQTREGRLQVELAHLTYQKSRLVRSWTHLERQRGARGAAGFLGGPGETQIEADRRMIDERIKSLKKQLETVVRTRELQRRNRRRVPYPIVALVGYTNAGK
ncbi:MAG TPA: GTPase HflX, partial [Alphaproteobacteria bacterium]|nr:GTPase HflX [Alphaproteobacteria bacterium]